MYGYHILGWISKVTFEILHNISFTYSERCVFFIELLDLRSHKHFCNGPENLKNHQPRQSFSVPYFLIISTAMLRITVKSLI